MSIKAIETVYNGYRFRSRLEARWAVFFDTLGVQYEYESEGFNVGKYGWYLPDFYLPDSNVFVEIKSRGNWFFDPKLDELTQINGYRIIYICGNPWPDEYLVWHYDPRGYNGYNADGYPLVFAWEEIDRKLWLFCEGEVSLYLSVQPTSIRSHVPERYHPVLGSAYRRARQARFEHGETP